LRTLPRQRFDLSQSAHGKVDIDRVGFDGNLYSLPYQLVQQNIEVRSSANDD
jgi:hypothetical protein